MTLSATPSIGSGPREPVKKQPAQDDALTAGPPSKSPGNEEPAFALEPDLPSDGRDEEGEAMIRALPERTELAEPPGQPSPPNPKP